MHDEKWLGIISRITPHEPVDLDQVVFDRSDAPVANLCEAQDDLLTIHSAKLWARGDEDISFIGVRVNTRLTDCSQAAFRLAAAALERGVTPIILTTLPDSGFDRFGFRVERLVGETPEDIAVQERELSHFWNLAITIDISDVASLG
ncbi:MAG: hypothetical protein ACU0CA_10720 [Paracoccaceae bacterium]